MFQGLRRGLFPPLVSALSLRETLNRFVTRESLLLSPDVFCLWRTLNHHKLLLAGFCPFTNSDHLSEVLTQLVIGEGKLDRLSSFPFISLGTSLGAERTQSQLLFFQAGLLSFWGARSFEG